MNRLILVMLLAACGPSLGQLQAREVCYNQAEAEAQHRVDAECSGAFAQCTNAGDILAELKRKQEACP